MAIDKFDGIAPQLGAGACEEELVLRRVARSERDLR